MGADPITLAVAAVVAGKTYFDQKAAAKAAAKEQERAQQTAQNARRNQEFEQRRQQIRQERVRRAQIEQSSQNTGTMGSSGQIGAESAVNTQTGQNVSNIQSDALASQAIGYYNQKAADAQYRGQVAGQLGSLGLSAISLYGNYQQAAGKEAAANQGISRTPTANSSPVEVQNPYNINLFQ